MQRALVLFIFALHLLYCFDICLAEPIELPKAGETKRYEIFEKVAHEKLNSIRKALGLSGLGWNELLADAANKHSLYMVANPTDVGHVEYSSKTGFSGSTPDERIRNVGYRSVAVGEAVAQVPFDKGRFIVEGLLDAPYHRLTLLDPRFTDVGISVLCCGDKNDVWQNATCFATFEFGGSTEKQPVAFPCNSIKVRTFFDCAEVPSPCVNLGDNIGQTGYIFTFQYYPKNMEITAESAITIKWDADRNRAGRDYIMLIPNLPLAPNSRFEFGTDKKCEFFTYRADNFDLLFEPQTLKVKGVGEYTAKIKIVGEGVNGFRGRKIGVTYYDKLCKFSLALLPSGESDDAFYLHFDLKEKGDCKSISVELEPDLPIPQSKPITYLIEF